MYYSTKIQDVSYYEKNNIKNITKIIPQQLNINGYILKYPEILPSKRAWYSLYDRNQYDQDVNICFNIKENKLEFKKATKWNRCSELDEDVDLQFELGLQIDKNIDLK